MDEDIVCSNRKLLVNIRFDFDILLTTNNQQIINGAFGGLPITYDKHPIKKIKINKKELYKFDKRAFDTRIGFITNISTSLYSMLNNFNKESKEYKKIILNNFI